jgi:hypothetical protein
MCVTEPIKGTFKLKGGDRINKDASALAHFGDGSDQFFSDADRGVTYVSRLQCV